MDENIFIRLQRKIETGKKNHKLLAKYFVDFQGDYKKLKISDVARDTLSSNATLVRFCQDLGYMGFTEFKIDLFNQSALFSGNDNMESRTELDFSDHFDAVIRSLKMTEIANDKFVLNSIVDRIKHSDRVDILGVGETNIVAQDFQLKLIRIGINATAHSDIHTQHFTVSNSTEATVAIGISYSGTSKSVYKNLKTAHENGATTFLITKPGLKKPKYIDFLINCSATESVCRVFSTTSRFSILFLFDIIYHELINTDKDFYSELLENTRLIKGR